MTGEKITNTGRRIFGNEEITVGGTTYVFKAQKKTVLDDPQRFSENQGAKRAEDAEAGGAPADSLDKLPAAVAPGAKHKEPVAPKGGLAGDVDSPIKLSLSAGKLQHPTAAAAKGEGEHEPDSSTGNQVDGTDSKGETSSLVERDVGGQTALGAGLRHMRVSELQKRAVATGAATSAIDAALDAQDTKAELIRLIVAHEAHVACKTPPQTVAPRAALPLQRATQSLQDFLVQLNLPQVQQRALELGVRKGLIDEALSQPSVRDGVLCLCQSSFSEPQCACR
eukprot:COSAG01_NODE_184_length_22692_cov_155.762758_2_plen_281_part_00